MRLRLPPLIASMNCVVPDLAIVPRLLMRSYLVIPIPVSVIATVFSSSSYSILIASSVTSPKTSGLYMLRNLILSKASAAFEITSLRKISF